MSKESKDSKKIRCSCGYCGFDGTSGIYFEPIRNNQKYAFRSHYKRYLYNGKNPYTRICKCGCNRKFYTINIEKYYIKGHQKIFSCTLCYNKFNKDEIQIKKMNGSNFFFCLECYSKINKEE